MLSYSETSSVTDVNVLAAWLGMLAGVLSGIVSGLRFHDAGWLGGYASWPRRMMRLGHIAFFGIAFINLAYALTIHELGWRSPPALVSRAMAGAVILMPAVCFLSAWRKPLRHLFAFPVVCVLVGVIGLLWERVLS